MGLWSWQSHAQFYPEVFQWNDNFLSSSVSPALVFEKSFYLSVPVISHTRIFWRNSAFTPYDLFGMQDADFNETWRRILTELSPGKGIFSAVNEEWFHVGWKKEGKFYQIRYRSGLFFLYQHPVSLYRAVAYGINTEIPPVKLNEIAFEGEMRNTLSFGINWPKENSGFGINFHFYNSGFYFKSRNNRGEIYVERSGEVYIHHFDDISLNITSAGLLPFIEEDKVGRPEVNPESVTKRIKRKLLWGNNLGLGMDVGFYKTLGKWQWNFSLLDAGFLYYFTDPYQYTVSGSFTYSGINPDFDNSRDYWKALSEQWKKQLQENKSTNNFIRFTHYKIYSGLKYFIGGKSGRADKLKCYVPWKKYAGEQSSDYLGITGFYQDLNGPVYWGASLYGHFRLGKYLDWRVLYGYENLYGHALGTGILLHAGAWHLFLSAYNSLETMDLSQSKAFTFRAGTYFAF